MASQRDPPGPTLPLDLLLAIIEEVVQAKDISTLRACSLLCHDLLPHCRKHIFRKFDMAAPGHDPDKYFNKFSTLLYYSPHLIPYVRDVRLLDFAVGDGLKANPILPHFLESLTHVEAFFWYFVQEGFWDEIPMDVREGLLELVTRPCLRELHLKNVGDISWTLLDSCSSLESLNITNCFPESESDDESTSEEDGEMAVVSERHPIYLKSLTLLNSKAFLKYFHPRSSDPSHLLRFSRLRSLTITLTPDSLKNAWKLIRSASSLKSLAIVQAFNLDITFGSAPGPIAYTYAPLVSEGSSDTLLPYVTLYPLSNLSQISFTVIIAHIEGRSVKRHLYELCLLLRSNDSIIEKVDIKIDLFALDAPDIERLFSDPNSRESLRKIPPFLQDLDETLSDSSILPSLASVRIHIMLADEYSHSTDSEYGVHPGSRLDLEPGRAPPELMSFEKVKMSVKRMMRLTRKTVRRRGGVFIVEVGVGDVDASMDD